MRNEQNTECKQSKEISCFNLPEDDGMRMYGTNLKCYIFSNPF